MLKLDTIIYSDLLIFCVFINIIIFVFLHKNHSKFNYSTRLFKLFTCSIIFLAVCEVFSWLFSIKGSTSLIPINYFFNLLFLTFNTLPVAFGLRYLDYKIFVSKKRNKRMFFLYLTPVYLVFCFMIYNIFNEGFLFSIDSENVYHRGIGTYIGNISALIITFIIIYTFYRHKQMINGRITEAIIYLTILPIIGAILQMLFYGLSLGIPAYTLAMFICLLLLERDEQLKDPLTHLNSRFFLERRLKYKLKSNEAFSVIIIDVNDFKKINDIYGHSTGDVVLRDISEILLAESRKEDLVCRYGGDEFFIILETPENIGQAYINRVDQKLIDYSLELPYSVTLSYGLVYVNNSKKYFIDELIKVADKKMYEDKKKRKSQT